VIFESTLKKEKKFKKRIYHLLNFNSRISVEVSNSICTEREIFFHELSNVKMIKLKKLAAAGVSQISMKFLFFNVVNIVVAVVSTDVDDVGVEKTGNFRDLLENIVKTKDICYLDYLDFIANKFLIMRRLVCIKTFFTVK